MSYNHPTVTEILNNSVSKYPEMRKYICKSYLQIAQKEFIKRKNCKPTISNSQELYDIYEEQWIDYYIINPQKEKENRKKGKIIWQYTINFKIDVKNSLCRFIEYKYSEFIETPERNNHWFNKILNKKGYYKESCADILEKLKINFIESFIIDNNLLEEYKLFINLYNKELPKYIKPKYTDYSEMAYNYSVDDL